MCGVSDADCRHYHRKVDHKCVFDLTKIPLAHISNPPNWGGRRGKRSENRQRKSSPPARGRQLRDPLQRRMLKYNYRCQHPHEYLEDWQVESTVHPRHLRWARRKRQSL